MPGRPRTTLKRLNKLAEQAVAYGNDLYELMPAQYLETPDPNDATCLAWRRAAEAAVSNYRALEALRGLVVAKVARAEGVAVTMATKSNPSPGDAIDATYPT